MGKNIANNININKTDYLIYLCSENSINCLLLELMTNAEIKKYIIKIVKRTFRSTEMDYLTYLEINIGLHISSFLTYFQFSTCNGNFLKHF